MNGETIIFWNSKMNDAAYKVDGRGHALRDAKNEFAKYPFPPTVEKWVFVWEPKKKPEIIKL